MQPVGFIMLCIGLGIILLAKRIVLSKVHLDEKDRSELEMLASGGVIAVRVAGFIVALVGIMFLMMR
ncbi:MAG: hypothetical protein ACRCSG_03090 [Cellulosilyticaceae bacterium]